MKTLRQNFGATFRAIRKSKNLNQDEVAEKAGLSTSYISDVERGIANPKLDTIEALSKALDVNISDFFEFSARGIAPQEAKLKLIRSIDSADDDFIMTIYHMVLNSFSK